MQRSTQSVIIISKQPVAPKTHILRLSPSNQFFKFSQPRLSRRVWKTSCLVRRWMSCSCWCNSSCNLSICPFKLVEKAPLRQCWISLQEYWLEFHGREVMHSLANSGTQVSCWRATSASWHSLIQLSAEQPRKGESGSLDQSGPVESLLK